MAVATNDTYSAASGATIYGGMEAPSALPAWVPPAGNYVADIPFTNTMDDVLLTMYGSADRTMVLNRWTSAAFIPEYGTYGAMAYHGGGHNPGNGLPNIQGVVVADLTALQFVHTNKPSQVWNEYDDFDAACLASDGSPMAPHTYNGLERFPSSWSPGTYPKGAMVRLGYPGGGPNALDVFDLDESTLGTTRLVDAVDFVGDGSQDGGSYIGMCRDDTRQGWWAIHNAACPNIVFIDKTGTVTRYAAGLNTNGNGAALSHHPQSDMLLLLRCQPASATQRVQVLNCASPASGWTNVDVTFGTASAMPGFGINPNDGVTEEYHPHNHGLEWSTLLNAWVSYDPKNDPDHIYKWTPHDLDDLTVGITLDLVEITGYGGASIALVTSQDAPHYTKLRECVPLRSFIWLGNKDAAPQCIRLEGM